MRQTERIDYTEPTKGLEVHVYSPDKKDYWGIGVITTVEPLTIEGTGEVLLDKYPSRIELKDGRITQGMECWWYPVTGP